MRRDFEILSPNIQNCYDTSRHDDSTERIQAAINRMAEIGGTVFLTMGAYGLRDTLYVPDGVTLLGEGEGLTNLVWHYHPQSNVEPPKCLDYIICGKNATVKNLKVTVFSEYDNIITAKECFTLSGVTIMATPYIFHRESVVTKIKKSKLVDTEGSDITVENCEVFGRGKCFSARNGENLTVKNVKIYTSDFGVLAENYKGITVENAFLVGKCDKENIRQEHGLHATADCSLNFIGCKDVSLKNIEVQDLRAGRYSAIYAKDTDGVSVDVLTTVEVEKSLFCEDCKNVSADNITVCRGKGIFAEGASVGSVTFVGINEKIAMK